jgi:hypothetical protein
MIPTTRLRFVQRSVHMGVNGGGKDVYQIVRVLQQWYTDEFTYGEEGEWLDVPLEADA